MTGYLEQHDNRSRSKFLSSGRLLVKIQDGCQRFCSFCIVPYLRGIPESESIKNLKLKIKNYEDQIQEVILTAINTEAYGYDTGVSAQSIPGQSIMNFYPFIKAFYQRNDLLIFFTFHSSPVQTKSLSL